MGLLDFFRGKPKGLSAEALYDPQRFADFSTDEWRNFVNELSFAVNEANLLVAHQKPAEIKLVKPELILYLDNIALDWEHADIDTRPNLLKNHLKKCILMNDRPPLSKEDLLDALCIRCYTEFQGGNDGNFFVRLAADKYFFVLSVNLENGYAALKREETVNFELDEDGIWAQTYSKLLDSEDLKLFEINQNNENIFVILHEDSAPAIALHLIESNDNMRGSLGSYWIPISTSMSVIILVNDQTAIDAANAHSKLFSEEYTSDDRPISINLHWWKPDGSWEVIPASQGLNKMYYYESPLAE